MGIVVRMRGHNHILPVHYHENFVLSHCLFQDEDSNHPNILLGQEVAEYGQNNIAISK